MAKQAVKRVYKIRVVDEDGDVNDYGPFRSQSAANEEYEAYTEAVAEENDAYSVMLLSREAYVDDDETIRWEIEQGVVVESEEDDDDE